MVCVEPRFKLQVSYQLKIGFCYVVFNSHMFNATEVQLCKWCFQQKFTFHEANSDAPERLSAFGARTFLVLSKQ
jgi:hypothetical protein